MQKITDSAGKIVAGWTTASPRSHYGQPVWEAERIPAVGEAITILFRFEGTETATGYPIREEIEEIVTVFWVHGESGWLLTHDPDSGGSTILAVNVHAHYWGRLHGPRPGQVYEQGYQVWNDFRDEESPDEESETFPLIIDLVERGELYAENTIQLPGMGGPLGSFL